MRDVLTGVIGALVWATDGTRLVICHAGAGHSGARTDLPSISSTGPLHPKMGHYHALSQEGIVNSDSGLTRSEIDTQLRIPGKKTHGGTGSKEYRSWVSMKQRCLNPRVPNYKYYGGRGIKIHAPWVASFEAFLGHVGKAPSDKHTLERVFNNKGYEPGNVRWATRREQARNRRSHWF